MNRKAVLLLIALAVTVRSAVPRPATGDDGVGAFIACAGMAMVGCLCLLAVRKKKW